MSFFSFVQEALKHPREVATVFPSSRFLARAMANQIEFSNVRTIVELGRGGGFNRTVSESIEEPISPLFAGN